MGSLEAHKVKSVVSNSLKVRWSCTEIIYYIYYIKFKYSIGSTNITDSEVLDKMLLIIYLFEFHIILYAPEMKIFQLQTIYIYMFGSYSYLGHTST